MAAPVAEKKGTFNCFVITEINKELKVPFFSFHTQKVFQVYFLSALLSIKYCSVIKYINNAVFYRCHEKLKKYLKNFLLS